MPITLLDIILLVVMLISGLLAMIRGFMREILSITAWIAAAGATIYVYSDGRLLTAAKSYFSGQYGDIIATVVVAGGTFFGTLIIVSIFTMKISDMILDSRIGALDRTLGFLFGLGRGLVIVTVAYLFMDWLVPQKSQPHWFSDAKSRVVLAGTGDWIKSLLPDDPESTILRRLKRPRDEGGEPADAPPARRSGLRDPAEPARNDGTGYDRNERTGMRQLIETKAAPAR